MLVANASKRPGTTEKSLLKTIFPPLALASYLYVLYHLPPGSIWRVAVAASSCVGLVASSLDLFGDSPDSFFSQQTRDRLIRPTICDIQNELDQARKQRETVNLVLTAVRGVWSLGAALILYFIMKIRNLSGLG